MSKTCLIILGMHRSGTSALAGFLHHLGISMGAELLEPAWDNPKGFYENKQVMLFNEYSLLPVLNSSWDDIKPIDWSKLEEKKEALFVKAREMIETSYKDVEIFGIKDPRMCILFPFWEDVLLSLGIKIKVLFIYRNPLEVAFSLFYRNGFSIGKGLILWAKHNLYAEYYSRKYPRVFISMDNILNNPENFVKNLKEELNLSISFDELKFLQASKFLTKEFKHYSFKISDLSETLPDFIKFPAIYIEKLCNKDIYFEGDLKEKFDIWRRQYETQIKEIHIESLASRVHAQVFFDIGNGFNEKDSIIHTIKPINSSQEIEISLPLYLKGLRFDPLNESCIVKLEKFELVDEKGLIEDVTKLVRSNANFVKENIFYFFHKDPQIYISDEVFTRENRKFKAFKCRLKYLSIGERSAFQSKLTQVEDELVRVRGELEAERNEKAELQTRLTQVEDELVRVYLSKSWRITRPLRWLRRKLRI